MAPFTNGTDSRSRTNEIAAEAARAIESMRKSSAKIMAQGITAGQAVGAASLEVLKAIWAAVLNLLRFLARLFGAKQQQAAAQTDSPSTEPASLINSESMLTANADEAQSLLKAAQDLPRPALDSFMRALEFAGVSGADRALIDIGRQPEFLNKSAALDAYMSSCLAGVITAIEKIDMHVVSAAHERAVAAQVFASSFKPPILTEDLVRIQRHALQASQLNDDEKVCAERLVKADDAMHAVAAHRQVIVDSTMLIASQAAGQGLELTPYAAQLQRVAGHEWAAKVANAAEMLNGLPEAVPAVQTPTSPLAPSVDNAAMNSVEAVDAQLDANSDAAVLARKTKIVTEFLSGIPGTTVAAAPTTHLTIAQRLKKAAEDSVKHNPVSDDDQFDGHAEQEKP